MTDTCDADNRKGEPCGLPAGWGTDHTGEGRCKLHGGASLRGEDNPAFEHGLFSDYLDEEDREAIDALEEQGDAEKLDELINWRLARLRRAVRALNEDSEQNFWAAFQQLVDQVEEPEADQIKELAGMLSLDEPFAIRLRFTDPREERAREQRLREMYQAGGLTLRQYIRRRGDEDLADNDLTVEIDGEEIPYGDHPKHVVEHLLQAARGDQGDADVTEGEDVAARTGGEPARERRDIPTTANGH